MSFCINNEKLSQTGVSSGWTWRREIIGRLMELRRLRYQKTFCSNTSKAESVWKAIAGKSCRLMLLLALRTWHLCSSKTFQCNEIFSFVVVVFALTFERKLKSFQHCNESGSSGASRSCNELRFNSISLFPLVSVSVWLHHLINYLTFQSCNKSSFEFNARGLSEEVLLFLFSSQQNVTEEVCRW